MKRFSLEDDLKVGYCIPVWLRDEQIKRAISRVDGRIEEFEGTRSDSVAVVCYGPSLNESVEEIRGFKYVISCSGAHKFLLDRGIVPTWHVEVDPREHKVTLMGAPHKDVEYLISSTCHPKVFDHLDGHKVKLWHVFDSKDEAVRVLPRGEWALTGGSSVGLRSLTIARFLGFTDLHVFGMDGCAGESGGHASTHPNQPKEFGVIDYNGVEYKTTSSLLFCAKQTFHELDMLPGVTATFHGNGLVQAMALDYKPQPKKGVVIGLNKPELISAEYKRLNEELHEVNLSYGVGGGKHAQTVIKLADSLKTRSILDYGCGKGYLAKSVPFPIWEYDPAVPEKQESPRPAELVVCTDVLEHIEPEKLDFVLDDLRRVTRKVGYFVIHTGPASKTLPDGRNAHLIQESEQWWTEKLSKFFSVGKVWQKRPELHYVVGTSRLAKAA